MLIRSVEVCAKPREASARGNYYYSERPKWLIRAARMTPGGDGV